MIWAEPLFTVASDTCQVTIYIYLSVTRKAHVYQELSMNSVNYLSFI